MKIINLTPHRIDLLEKADPVRDRGGGEATLSELIDAIDKRDTLLKDADLSRAFKVLRSFPSEGLARCKEIIEESDPIDSIPIQRVRYGSIEGLPAPKDSVFYIVSHLVRMARPQRLDLLSPGEVARGEDGNILGCVNFFRNGHVSKS